MNADAFTTLAERNARKMVPSLVAGSVLDALEATGVTQVTMIHLGSEGEITKALIATTNPAHADMLHTLLMGRPEFLQALTQEGA